MLYTIKARSVVMISSARGAGLTASEAAAEAMASGGDGGSMTSAALERVVSQATAAYNEWCVPCVYGVYQYAGLDRGCRWRMPCRSSWREF